MARIAGIVLAAGLSSRFGDPNKLCALIGDVPVIRRVVVTALEAGLADLIVVTGNDRDQIAHALDGLAVRLVHNDDWQNGMGTSIAAGTASLDADVDGAFIIPGDMPFLKPAMFETLTRVFQQNQFQAIVFPATISGEQRNPVLWPRPYFSKLCELSGHEGAKQILSRAANRSVPVAFGDEIVFADVDTHDDLVIAQRDAEQNPH